MYLHYFTFDIWLTKEQRVISSYNRILTYKEFEWFMKEEFKNTKWVILNHTVINDLFNNTVL